MNFLDFEIPSTRKLKTQNIDPDTAEHCLDKKHYWAYPHSVDYVFNSRGFRDQEWPQDLSSAVWCFGDSFTVGIGCPLEHTWPWILQKKINQRTINISMNGASNNWMARRSLQIIQKINPARCVFHWSYLHRREKEEKQAQNELWQTFYKNIKDSSWPDCLNCWQIDQLPYRIQKEIKEDFVNDWQTPDDEFRRLHFCTTTLEQDVENTVNCISSVCQAAPNSIHSFIPQFATTESKLQMYERLKKSHALWIPELPVQDLARDGLHYDKKTAESLVDQILELW